MSTASLDRDRVGPWLLWGAGFSIVFHAVLFSPQLSRWLRTEGPRPSIATLPTAADALRAIADTPPADAPEPPPEARDPESGQPLPPEQQPPAGEEQQPQAPPPGAVVKTPEPVPAYPESDEVTIGRDDGDPMSVVIIGRDAFEEHMAQLSQVSQAGFRMSDAGGDGSQGFGRGSDGLGSGGGGSAAASETTGTVTADAGVPPTPQVPTAPEPAPATAQPTPEPTPPPPPIDEPDPSDPPPPAPPPTPTGDEPMPPADVGPKPPSTDEITPPKRPESELPPVPDAPPPPPPATPTPAPERGPTVPPAPEVPPTAKDGGGVTSTERPANGPRDQAPGERGKAGGSGPSPVPGTGGQGALSDLESAPTSTVRVDPKLWKNGRLVSARGIQLKPRSPQFTMLQQVSQLPNCRSPVVTLFFDRTGKCVRAIINRSSGDRDIDFAIEAALYFWKAAGKQIDALQGEQTVHVTLELLL